MVMGTDQGMVLTESCFEHSLTQFCLHGSSPSFFFAASVGEARLLQLELKNHYCINRIYSLEVYLNRGSGSGFRVRVGSFHKGDPNIHPRILSSFLLGTQHVGKLPYSFGLRLRV